jgi:hypothetical protein
MQVHHGFEVNDLGAHTVNDGLREAVKVELSINASNFTPALRFGQDTTQRALKFVKKGVPQTRLPLLIPPRRRRQFLVGIRMADDLH